MSAGRSSSASCSTSSTSCTSSRRRRRLVEEEFNNVWKTVARRSASRRTAPSRTRARPRRRRKEEYRDIAERRVRLGLVLAEIGERNNIKVTDEELSRADRRARPAVPRPGAGGLGLLPQEPEALASLRAPIFEEKVVDFILELAKVTDKTVSREELYKEDEDDRPLSRCSAARSAPRTVDRRALSACRSPNCWRLGADQRLPSGRCRAYLRTSAMCAPRCVAVWTGMAALAGCRRCNRQ